MRRTSSTVITRATLAGPSDNGRPVRRDAVDEQGKPEREPRAADRRTAPTAPIGQLGARGVPLQPGLLVGGEAEHVVDDRAGGQLGVCVSTPASAAASVSRARICAIASDWPAAKLAETSSAPSVCDSSASRSRRRCRAMRFCQSPGGVVDRLEDPVGDGAEQLLLVGEMPVQRAGGDVELAGQPAHGQVGDPVVVQESRSPASTTSRLCSCTRYPNLNTVQVGFARRYCE